MLVEGLADRFEPALCDAYARLFSQAVALSVAGCDAASLVARYERVRRARPWPASRAASSCSRASPWAPMSP